MILSQSRQPMKLTASHACPSCASASVEMLAWNDFAAAFPENDINSARSWPIYLAASYHVDECVIRAQRHEVYLPGAYQVDWVSSKGMLKSFKLQTIKTNLMRELAWNTFWKFPLLKLFSFLLELLKEFELALWLHGKDVYMSKIVSNLQSTANEFKS